MLVALAACGKDDAPERAAPAAPVADVPAPAAPSPDEAPAPAAPATGSPRSRGSVIAPAARIGEEPHDSTELGALYGTVLFEGEPPERFELGATKLKECQHHPEVDQRANEVVVDGEHLAGVFVTLRSGYDEKRVPAPASTPATLDQRGCMYVPRTVGMQLGQKLLVTNSDPTNHNVHARPKKSREVNSNMGAGQPALEFTFDRAEKPVPFACDIHPWMGAEVYVEEHPWFAVTGADGAFRIADVPPGEYVVEALHAKLGSAAGSVSVTAGRATGFTLTLRGK